MGRGPTSERRVNERCVSIWSQSGEAEEEEEEELDSGS